MENIKIVTPKGCGSFYWNYKGSNSLVLMVVVNANYEFLYCDIGTNGCILDGGVIENTKFYEYLVNDRLELPPQKKPRNGTIDLPYVFVGNKVFALCQEFFKPFSQKNLNTERRNFNYRLS
jgi:hypothetical protein